ADTDGVKHQGERTWYVYDSAGQRVRKVTEVSTGQVKHERIYLSGFEIYRKNGTSPLVRETLHIMDDKQRVALVETRTQGSEPGVAKQLIRYQFSNHLGSASLELDNQAQIISYEEYSPYGSTTYQAVCSQTEVLKGYRFTGKEKDNENGLYYYGARYYAPWLGRWTSVDPLDMRIDSPESPGAVDHSSQELSEVDTSENAKTGHVKLKAPLGDTRTNTYYYADDNPIVFYDPDGESPVSIIIKQAAKVGIKKALKEYIKNTVKSKIREYVGKKVLSKAFAKQLAKDADNVTSLLDSEWWEYAIELVPIAGDAYGAISLGKKGKAAWDKITAIEKRLERVKKWTSRWGEDAAKRIDDAVQKRERLRKAAGASDELVQAHHVIPVEVLKENEVAQAAVVAGFDFNAKANAWLLKRSEHLAGHKEFNELLTERLETWAKQNPGFTPTQAREFIEKEVIPEWRKNFVEAVTH
ncbi:MAG TPA: RHS repeat-associated core domain-containing protein, partial [Nitrososphaera sp.]|nr:RHS repeat-associated core domain-containing protein [Nitrososphaera sp.]